MLLTINAICKYGIAISFRLSDRIPTNCTSNRVILLTYFTHFENCAETVHHVFEEISKLKIKRVYTLGKISRSISLYTRIIQIFVFPFDRRELLIEKSWSSFLFLSIASKIEDGEK